jgi:hypothetical protein
MIRKFRKIFRPTTNKTENGHTTSSPESTSDNARYVKHVSSTISKQLFPGRQKNSF